ncbi:DegT/DnrJ/EryC1/StrS family aminotransferase [Alteromonas sp. ASW11-130]|uniref:DegT/DnrJ/EryC1/StrS family aminotransferase n=1 Tax=Alteromonas sp. ASW11-130 TaxID=3015775 RepID=UPI002241BB13|nr:DegT/DnrJ/EryC1/StrS family aminotransferase [Alteromonas sp. ASW11-130]MCW8091273.1 DegT/DnrJ/EryC1/StrS family aminotransferase [Alteromonas sp. ASW11-130]
MSLTQLPPVGTPLITSTKKFTREPEPINFLGFAHTFLNSGTAALGLILTRLVQHSANPKRKVIIPGYACPDLVAACEFARTQAVIVDFDAASYQYDLTQLNSLKGEILAVICPSLVGISMPIQPLRDVLADNVYIIEDNAQWFPEHEDPTVRAANLENFSQYILPSETQHCDFFIASFGRGKPVNMLGGGLVAWKKQYNEWFDNVQRTADDDHSTAVGYSTRIKAHIFNFICHPLPYGMLCRLPFLKLGATTFHPLENIESLDKEKIGLSRWAALKYLSQSTQVMDFLKLNIPFAWSQQGTDKRLLRFPMLAVNKQVRDKIVAKCNEYGLGASAMYEKPLSTIDDIAQRVEQPFPTPIADSIANGFFTLPVHAGVTYDHALQMAKLLSPYYSELRQVPAL